MDVYMIIKNRQSIFKETLTSTKIDNILLLDVFIQNFFVFTQEDSHEPNISKKINK